MDTIHLRNYTLESVQNMFNAGHITEDQWEGYAHAWRTGAPRYSSEMAAYTLHDFTTDGAKAVAEELGCCKLSCTHNTSKPNYLIANVRYCGSCHAAI